MQNADQRNTEWLRDGKLITKSSAIEIDKVNNSKNFLSELVIFGEISDFWTKLTKTALR